MEAQRFRVPATGHPTLARERQLLLSRVHVASGEPVPAKQLDQKSLCVVRSGCIRLDQRLSEGRSICVGLMGAGNIFVLEPAPDDRPARVVARAFVDSTVTIVNHGQLAGLLVREPELASALVGGMMRRQSELQRLVGHILTRDAGVRLAAVLIGLADAIGEPFAGGGQLIPLPLTHQELAEMIGSSRVTVTRKLLELQRENCLHKAKGRRFVIFLDRLRAQAHIRTG